MASSGNQSSSSYFLDEVFAIMNEPRAVPAMRQGTESGSQSSNSSSSCNHCHHSSGAQSDQHQIFNGENQGPRNLNAKFARKLFGNRARWGSASAQRRQAIPQLPAKLPPLKPLPPYPASSAGFFDLPCPPKMVRQPSKPRKPLPAHFFSGASPAGGNRTSCLTPFMGRAPADSSSDSDSSNFEGLIMPRLGTSESWPSANYGRPSGGSGADKTGHDAGVVAQSSNTLQKFSKLMDKIGRESEELMAMMLDLEQKLKQLAGQEKK